MGFYAGTNIWRDVIYQLETSDPVVGGTVSWRGGYPTSGFSNAPIQNLADRTTFLKGKVDELLVEVGKGLLSEVEHENTDSIEIVGDGSRENPLRANIRSALDSIAWTRGNNTYTKNNLFRGLTEVEDPLTSRGAVNKRTLEAGLGSKADKTYVDEGLLEAKDHQKLNNRNKPDAHDASAIGFRNRSIADRLDEWISFKDHGAVGDGVTDDTEALQSAINEASLKGLTLKGVGGLTYRVTATLKTNGSLSLDLNGDTINGESIPIGTTYNEQAVIKITGSALDPITVGEDILKGETVISIEGTTGLQSDDYVLISSDQRMVDGYGNPGNGRGELCKVKRVIDDNTIELSSGTLFSYSKSFAAKIEKINPLFDVSIKNGTIVAGGSNSRHTGLQLHYCVSPIIENLNIVGGNDVGISTFYCYGGRISGGSISDSEWMEPGDPETSGGTGYGICLYYATRDFLIENVSFYRCNRAITGGGKYPSVNCLIRFCTAEDMLNGFGGHEPCWYWAYEDCVVRGARQVGMNVRGQFTKIHRCKFFDCAGYGIIARTYYVNPLGVRGTEIIDCDLIRTSGIILDGNATTGRIVDTVIRGTKHDSCQFNNITIRRSDNVLIDGVRIFNQKVVTANDGQAIVVSGSAIEGDFCTNILINNTEVLDAARRGFQLNHTKKAVIRGCNIHQAQQDSIYLNLCEEVSVSGGLLRGGIINFTGGVRVINCKKTTVVNNIIEGNGDDYQEGNHGILFVGNNSLTCEDNTANGNTISGFSSAIVASGSVNFSMISGNNGRNCYGPDKFVAAGESKVVINNIE